MKFESEELRKLYVFLKYVVSKTKEWIPARNLKMRELTAKFGVRQITITVLRDLQILKYRNGNRGTRLEYKWDARHPDIAMVYKVNEESVKLKRKYNNVRKNKQLSLPIRKHRFTVGEVRVTRYLNFLKELRNTLGNIRELIKKHHVNNMCANRLTEMGVIKKDKGKIMWVGGVPDKTMVIRLLKGIIKYSKKYNATRIKKVIKITPKIQKTEVSSDQELLRCYILLEERDKALVVFARLFS